MHEERDAGKTYKVMNRKWN